MADELSIEETNALRATLGLKPLRGPAPSSESSSLLLPNFPQAKKLKQEKVSSAKNLQEGEFLTVDADVLDEDEDNDPILIRAFELQKKEKPNDRLIHQMMEENEKDEEIKTEIPSIKGAKLFVSDLHSPPELNPTKKPTAARKKMSIPVVPKINREVVTTVLEEDEEEAELQRLLGGNRIKKLQHQVHSVITANAVKEEEELVPMSRLLRKPMEEEELKGTALLRPPESYPEHTPPVQSLPQHNKTEEIPVPPPNVEQGEVAVPKFYRRSLSTTLKLVLELGKGGTMENQIIVGRAKDARPIENLNRPGDLVNLEYRDDHGRMLTTKEAYRQLKYQFRGDGPGPRKKMLRELQLQREQAQRSGTNDSGFSAKDLVAKVQKDHIVLRRS